MAESIALRNRIAHVRTLLADHEIDTLMVLADANRRYLSGFTAEDLQIEESSGVLLMTQDKLILATDSRYFIQAQEEAPLYEVVVYREGLANELPALVQSLNTRKLGFEGERLSYAVYQKFKEVLKEASPTVELVSTEDIVENMRMIKSRDEIERTRKALDLAEQVFLQVIQSLAPGMTEKEVAWAMEKGMREAGADQLAFPVIVASGPNSALPHAVPSDRRLQRCEPILFDWGARLNGYCSDTSRTIVLGEPDQTFVKVHQTVLEAQQLAIQAIKSGANTKEIDALARAHIDAQGFQGKFSHSLGHGTGLVVHEGPRLGPVKEFILQSGMLITVEPGIYLPDWGGVRIENQVVVGNDGAQVLNRLQRSYSIAQLLNDQAH